MQKAYPPPVPLHPSDDYPPMNIYFHIFWIFAKIGAFTIGGGYAMVGIIQKELVERLKWIDEDEFLDILALAQSSPGLLAVNISIFAGYRLKGVKGSIVATLGSVMPSFLIILAIALFLSGYQDNIYVMRAFKAMRPVVVALIAAPVINMAIKAKLNGITATIAIATALLILFAEVSPLVILFVAALFFIASESWRSIPKRPSGGDKPVDGDKALGRDKKEVEE